MTDQYVAECGPTRFPCWYKILVQDTGTGTVLMGSLSTRYLVRRRDKFYFRMWLPVQFARLLRIPEVKDGLQGAFWGTWVKSRFQAPHATIHNHITHQRHRPSFKAPFYPHCWVILHAVAKRSGCTAAFFRGAVVCRSKAGTMSSPMHRAANRATPMAVNSVSVPTNTSFPVTSASNWQNHGLADMPPSTRRLEFSDI